MTVPNDVLSQPNPFTSTKLRVSGEALIGVKLSEIERRLEAGRGDLDPTELRSVANGTRRMSLTSSVAGPIGGLRTYLSDTLGNGYLDMIEVSSGFLMSITDARYRRQHEYTFPKEQLFKIRVLCSGAITTPNPNLRTVGGTAHVQFAEIGAHTSYLVHPAKPLQMVSIIITPATLNLLGLAEDMLPGSVSSMFGAAGDRVEVLPIDSCFRLIRIASEVIESRKSIPHELRLSYLRGKAYEFFCEAVQRLQPVSRESRSGHNLDRADISLVREAKQILTCALEQPPTIKQLSRLVGVNRTKLNATFRDYFGETIHAYQTRVRMREAERLLCESDMQISEISAKVGFKHPSNFTHVVKKFYSVSPKQLRRQKQGELIEETRIDVSGQS